MGNEIPKETPIVLVPEGPTVRKHFRLNKWHVITVVLVAVIFVQGSLYVNLSLSYNTLNADHKSLTSEHNYLSHEYDALRSQYMALQSEHSTLQDSHGSLQANYSSLQTHHNSLQSDYNSLNSNYNSYISNYDSLASQINNRALGTDGEYFITPQDLTVSNLVMQVTGGWSNRLDWNEYWTDTKLLYDWVVNNIEYRSDGLYPLLPSTPSGNIEYQEEMWQLPSETLNLGKGDCEDMAILLVSMILSYNGMQNFAECILITGSNNGHAAVQIPVAGDKVTILDPAGKYYTQTFGLIDNKDISTEINNWLNYWKPEMGSDVHVNRVFSSYTDRSFSSTGEYISWMYNR